MSHKPQYHVGLLGTGYIADYHARALACLPEVQLVAVCDANHARANAFASRHGIRGVYDSIEAMLGNEMLQVVHVLTPPDHHAEAGERLLSMGVHILLEKPMCTDAESCGRLLALAERKGLRVGVNHNFLFHPAYERLRADVRGGLLGSIDQITIDWALELPQLRSGPFDIWALRHPANIVHEIGPHVVSQMLDLVPVPEKISVYPTNEMHLADGRTFYTHWQVLAWCGRTAVDLRFSFAPGCADRSVRVRGTLGLASADLERNTYTLQRHGRYAQDRGKYNMVASMGASLSTQARRNLLDYILSKASRHRQGNAFSASIFRSLDAFYRGLSGRMDPRCGGQMGRLVVEQCGRIATEARLEPATRGRIVRFMPGIRDRADVVVFGGTGFIGRELVRQLLRAGQRVRVVTRSPTSVPFDENHSGLQIVSGDIRKPADVALALQNATNVFHLARAPGGTWSDYYQQDVLGTRLLGETCISQGIRRVVYVSSIVAYNTGGRRVITENTPFDRAICRQNKYARAKAEAEQCLMCLHENDGLPVVIVRPGMVIGKGGDLCHGGIGTWNGPGACVLWGNRDNKLPLVLVEDVARGLVAAMNADGAEGQSFNLVADPCLCAREYLQEIERFAGISIRVFHQPVWSAFGTDVCKWLAKMALRMPDRCVPRYRVWWSRTARAVFDCSKAKEVLGWQPTCDRDSLVARGIHVHLIDAIQVGRPGSAAYASAERPELDHVAQ